MIRLSAFGTLGVIVLLALLGLVVCGIFKRRFLDSSLL